MSTGGVVVVRVLVGGVVVVGMEHGSKGVRSKWVCERVTTAKEVSKEVEGVHGGIGVAPREGRPPGRF